MYKDEAGHHYKPMGINTITKKVKSELKKNKKSPYSICQTAVLTPKANEKPDKRGYYTKDQIHYQMVDIDDGGEFIKENQNTKKYHDWKRHKDIEV